MNNKNQMIRHGVAAVLAALMAGTAADVMLTAMQVPHGGLAVWLTAGAAALLCGLIACSGVPAIAAAVVAVVGGGVCLAANLDDLAAVPELFARLLSPEGAGDVAALSGAGAAASAIAAAVLAALLFLMLDRRAGTPLALLLEFTVLIGSYALCEEMSFGRAAPGLAASLAAFALAGEVQRDAGAWRALIPAGLAVAVALMLTPAGRMTWEPLENAAQRIRAAFEDYFQFAEERVPFTISTEGYNHAVEADGSVVSQLGGPATPDPEPVMRVTSDANVLLRGAIRRTYTGNSWIDNEAKARYLYYDFTHRHVRERVFGMQEIDGLDEVAVSVELLDAGTSSLFVPARMASFDMDLETAVYYNSIGEIFMSRPARVGDRYALTGYNTGSTEALRAAVLAAREREDDDDSRIREENLQLPLGIEEGVYALAIELTKDCENAWDKAAAIEGWLRSSCVYTLSPAYPDSERDFVSQFVLDSREGYCSYFASAMTVMCRIAGLPARYVEGYSVDAGTEVIVTGENAHAWTEVYFNGVGWIPFDVSNGAGGGDDGLSGETKENDTAFDVDPTEAPEHAEPDVTPEPQSEPTPPPDDGAQEELPPEPTPTPEPENEDWAGTLPEDSPAPEPTLGGDPPSRSGQWLWWLLAVLLLLAILAAAVLLVRRRLEAVDPIRMSARAPTAQQASLILYRAMLTLLARLGQTPMSGETPVAFARRVCTVIDNPDFVEFAGAVALCAYARAAADRETVDRGRRAYSVFLRSMKRGERLRYALTRLMKGLGDTESIP